MGLLNITTNKTTVGLMLTNPFIRRLYQILTLNPKHLKTALISEFDLIDFTMDYDHHRPSLSIEFVSGHTDAFIDFIDKLFKKSDVNETLPELTRRSLLYYTKDELFNHYAHQLRDIEVPYLIEFYRVHGRDGKKLTPKKDKQWTYSLKPDLYHRYIKPLIQPLTFHCRFGDLSYSEHDFITTILYTEKNDDEMMDIDLLHRFLEKFFKEWIHIKPEQYNPEGRYLYSPYNPIPINYYLYKEMVIDLSGVGVDELKVNQSNMINLNNHDKNERHIINTIFALHALIYLYNYEPDTMTKTRVDNYYTFTVDKSKE